MTFLNINDLIDMKKIAVVVGTYVGVYFACLALLSWNRPAEGTVKELPSIGIQEKFEEDVSLFIQSCAAFEESIEQASRATVVAEFLQLRLDFKKMEFLIAHTDPQLFNQCLNGAPLPKVMQKVPDLSIIEPQGLQRIEEVVYTDNFDRTELTQLFKKFHFSMKQFEKSLKSRRLYDADVFEAVRLGLIRLNTLNVTGFDAPANSDKVNHESIQILKGMKSILENYFEFSHETKTSELAAIFDTGIQQLEEETFESFDHLSFLTNVINPLWKSTLILQKELNVELPSLRSSLPKHINYEAENLFAENFLNASTFGEFAEGDESEKHIELGRKLFFDPLLSGDKKMACATCHDPKKAFTDGLPTSRTNAGLSGKRNSPTLLNAVYATRYFHDVRTDRLSLQMDHVVYNPDEFATDYDEMIAKLNQSEEYQKMFNEVYGSMKITKQSVTNAMSRYVSSLRSFNSDFDKFVRGETKTISESVKRGYNLFQGKATCATCHFAPTFAGVVPPFYDETETEVLGVPKIFKEPYELDDDPGRYANNIIMEKAPFYERSFKTPTLRNIALTGPYMHNGSFETLEEVIDFYDAGGGVGLGLDVPYQTLPGDSLKLSDQEKEDIIHFLEALTDTTGMN